ncbi:MAG: site-specific integrase [Acidimicrobiales bacterium]
MSRGDGGRNESWASRSTPPSLLGCRRLPRPAHIDDFLVWLTVEKGRAANTLAAYRRDLSRYQAHLGEREHTPIDATSDDVIKALVTPPEADDQQVRHPDLTAVRGLHRFLVAEEAQRRPLPRRSSCPAAPWPAQGTDGRTGHEPHRGRGRR